MRNLNRLTNYANKLEAWRDWRAIAKEACRIGRADLVIKFAPAADASWRKIDKCTAAVKDGLNEAQTAETPATN